MTSELDRILALSAPPAPIVRVEPRASGAPPLRPVQVAALGQWARALSVAAPGPLEWGPPGLAVLAGCGFGKTLIGLLLPAVAKAVLGRPVTTLYLTPASLVSQLGDDAEAWSRWYPVERFPLVLSHESLSAPRGRYVLRDAAPDVLVIDEAHGFADRKSGRWRRLQEYLVARPDARVVVMSGSLSWRSIEQCRHVLYAALRAWTPLPLDRTQAGYWGAVLDARSEPSDDDLLAMRPLVSWAYPGTDPKARPTRELARLAYRCRLESTPGVVLTSSSAVDVSLRIEVVRPPEPPEAVRAAVERLEERWEFPDGTEIVSALEFARFAATVPLGLYSRWRPETVDPRWVEARRAWSRVVRGLVEYRGLEFQTPAAATEAAEESVRAGRPVRGLSAHEVAVFEAWRAVEATIPAPETEDVWLEGGLDHLRAVVQGAGVDLVWTKTPALGRAVAAILRGPAGGRASYHGAGSAPPTGGPAVASILVHGTGWDGAPRAGYSRALVLEPPSSGAIWEQLLARLHRPGQKEDVVWSVFVGTGAAFGALRSAAEDATYALETTGATQRFLDADWVGWSGARRVRGFSDEP